MVLNPELRDLQDARIHILKIKKLIEVHLPFQLMKSRGRMLQKYNFILKKMPEKVLLEMCAKYMHSKLTGYFFGFRAQILFACLIHPQHFIWDCIIKKPGYFFQFNMLRIRNILFSFKFQGWKVKRISKCLAN